jgi:hypothetical protein
MTEVLEWCVFVSVFILSQATDPDNWTAWEQDMFGISGKQPNPL